MKRKIIVFIVGLLIIIIAIIYTNFFNIRNYATITSVKDNDNHVVLEIYSAGLKTKYSHYKLKDIDNGQYQLDVYCHAALFNSFGQDFPVEITVDKTGDMKSIVQTSEDGSYEIVYETK